MISLRRVALLLGSCGAWALACAPGSLTARVLPSAPNASVAEKLGPGYYLTQAPKELTLPGNIDKRRVLPKITEDFKQTVVSNDWWSSLIWQNDTYGPNPYSDPLYAHPFTLKARAEGVEIGYPTKPEVSSYQYMYWHQNDVLIGLNGVKSKDTRVAAYSDWTVTAAWKNDSSELRATFGHGLPFVYFIRRGSADARITPSHEWTKKDPATKKEKKEKLTVDVWGRNGDTLGFSVGDRHYVAYAPGGAEWREDGASFVSDLAGKDFFSFAVLPDREPATLELFRAHSDAFVTDTKVSYRYDAKTATQYATFDVKTELKEQQEGGVNEPLLALYRHQWKNTKAKLSEKSYVSPRGEMKLLAAPSFTTEMRFNGAIPFLPNIAGDEDDLEFYVKQVYWSKDLFPPGLGDKPQRDAYWDGKSFLRNANALQIADQIGYESARDHLLQAIKNELEDWFDGVEPRAFYYDKTWRSLIAVPEGFGSGHHLNDHHFHYGYFGMAAAIVAKYDPAWAKRWQPYIDLLFKDAANWDRSDERFPHLRYMDPYAGHSWANGPALFPEGNNEESSSEDVSFSGAAVLWGALTGNTALRDLGIFLYTQQAAAVEQYWWDIDQKVYPKGFDHTAVAMVWGAGGRYDTWWDRNPIYIHGINFVPAGGNTLYMGRHPEYVKRNYGEIVRRNQGEPLIWRDILWMYLAFAEPERALKLFEDDPYFVPEYGNSHAMTLHWISNLGALGHLDTEVTADTPTYAAFRKGNVRTHIAFNPTSKPLTVRFSDGVSLSVKPRQLAHDSGAAK